MVTGYPGGDESHSPYPLALSATICYLFAMLGK